MTKLARLYLVMLRYRIAAMVALFMLLGAAREGRLELGPRYLLAALALASSYVAATALNDLADEAIDQVNHPRDAGRPLVEGTATRRELLLLHVVASILALCAAIPLGGRGIGLVLVSLLVSQAYSGPPVRLSYRVAGAPLALGIAYVVVPYSLGITAAQGSLRHAASALTCALFLLFAARIVLKDFRDRVGDARYGKPTLLLCFGKTTTCVASLCALVAGDVVLVAALEPALWAFVQAFLARDRRHVVDALARRRTDRRAGGHRYRRTDGERPPAVRARMAAAGRQWRTGCADSAVHCLPVGAVLPQLRVTCRPGPARP